MLWELKTKDRECLFAVLPGLSNWLDWLAGMRAANPRGLTVEWTSSSFVLLEVMITMVGAVQSRIPLVLCYLNIFLIDFLICVHIC